jgi:hypothetical protein
MLEADLRGQLTEERFTDLLISAERSNRSPRSPSAIPANQQQDTDVHHAGGGTAEGPPRPAPGPHR